MSKKQAKIITVLSIIFLSLGSILYLLLPKHTPKDTTANNVEVKAIQKENSHKNQNTPTTENVNSEKEKEEVKFILKIGEESREVTGINGETLYEILKKMPGIVLEGKEYPELGFFVTKIGMVSELSRGGGKELFYYINGEESSVGVSSYVPKGGDIISWRLK